MEESAQLKKDNLKCRLTSIPMASLPLTFSHLIQVAERLGVRYVWIDSLCIVQDSTDDWIRESSTMGSVYSHACCTIAASASENAAGGLFRDAGLSIHDSVLFRCSSKDGKSRAIKAMKLQNTWDVLYNDGFLHQRGWVLQERELSPRVLHFTSSQVLWECREFKATEGWPHGNTKDPDSKYSPLLPRMLDTIQPANKQSIFDAWHSLVSDYSARSLTKETDTLVALSGIARVISKYTNCEYFAGIWSDDLLRSLCWVTQNVRPGSAEPRGLRSGSIYIAPSWSWASMHKTGSGVEFAKSSLAEYRRLDGWELDAEQATVDFDAIAASVKNVRCAAANKENPFGQVVAGHLEITAGLTRAVVNGSTLNDSTGKIDIGEIIPDDISEMQGIKVVDCLCLLELEVKDQSNGVHVVGAGLALLPVPYTTATYRRVGYIEILNFVSFTDAKVIQFVII